MYHAGQRLHEPYVIQQLSYTKPGGATELIGETRRMQFSAAFCILIDTFFFCLNKL